MKNLPIYFIVLGLISIIFFNFKFQNKNETHYMDHFSNDPFTKEWKTIDSLEQQGLPRSAFEEVKKLYKKVKSSNNPAQLVKCLLYQSKYISQLEEDGLVQAMIGLNKEIDMTEFPARPILQSILAEAYLQYLDNNQWRLSNRSTTTGDLPEDLLAWTPADFTEESRKLLFASIENDELKKVDLNDFQSIVDEGKNTSNFRPTLYDFLVHRALNQLSNQRSYLTKPSYSFYLSDDQAFAPLETFIKHTFTAQQQDAPEFQALLIYQQLLSFRLEQGEKAALVDADLQRLEFAYQKGIQGHKDALYLSALEALRSKYSNHESYAEISAKLARMHLSQSSKYKAGIDNAYKWSKRTAHEICEEAIKAYPTSYGAAHCKRIQAEIEVPSIQFTIEEVNLPEKPQLALIQHQNLTKAHFRLLAVDQDEADKIREMRRSELPENLEKINPYKEWIVDLPNDGDYHSHSTEIKIPELPLGNYVLTCSTLPSITDPEAILHYEQFQISRIGYWVRNNRDQAWEFYVADRETGTPLSSVKAEIFRRENGLLGQRWKKEREFFSDGVGYIKTNLRENKSYRIIFSKGQDVLSLNENYYGYGSWTESMSNPQTTFFTDRSIYRPGQTIYFKAVVTEKDGEGQPKILSNQEVEITFYDANYQKVESLKLRTNDFGTVNGSFIAPRSGLLGQMYIQSNKGNDRQYLRVEEYKRPRFEVQFKPVEGSYKFDEEVNVKGTAMMYAGSPVDGATVKYRVVRRVRYPYWFYWYYLSYRPGATEDTEIANGESKTDEEGNFDIKFIALPDRSIPKGRKPQFDYTVYAEVVDITGETQSSQTIVSAGHIALKVDVNIQEEMNRATFKALELTTENLNGQFEPAEGEIEIALLDAPENDFRERYWPLPDTQIISEEAFRKDFPHDPYGDEHLPQNWPVSKKLLETSFNTAENKTLELNSGKWPIGQYKLILKTKDKFGSELEIKKYFSLFDPNEKEVPDSENSFFYLDKNTCEVGETASLKLGSSMKPINLLFEWEHDKKITSAGWNELKGIKSFEQLIEEKHRGGFHYHWRFMKHNRSYQGSGTISVPWSNKQLNIEYLSFRDKLQPGADEKWQIKISGPGKEKVAAELVASMYDASLDAFTAHQWNAHFYPTSSMMFDMQPKGFEGNRSRGLSYYRSTVFEQVPSRIYPSLNWHGYYPGYGGIAFLSSRRAGQADGISLSMEKAGTRAFAYAEVKTAAAEEPLSDQVDANADMEQGLSYDSDDSTKDPETTVEQPIRTNLEETAFFLPSLKTDAEGNVLIEFKMKEALTRWKLQLFAHTKALEYAFSEKTIVTQKELMILPNAPRFFREGDKISFPAKINNLTEDLLSGQATLELFDAISMQPVNQLFGLSQNQKAFEVKGKQSTVVHWELEVPKAKVSALIYRVKAKSGNFADGEENALPVLTNRMLVTESKPLAVRGKEKKRFVFESLKSGSSSESLQNHSYTLEFTSNPAWYAVQALPYLMEYPYECSEQIFNRYYANALATSVANSHPRIKQVFDQWRNMPEDQGSSAFLSNLSKNQELKSALLEETPWVLNAQNEEQQKKNIALLFDLNRMADEQAQALAELEERQSPGGGFSWFPGARDSWYITQYIAEGIGHLSKLNATQVVNSSQSNPQRISNKAIKFIDQKIVEQYQELQRRVNKGYTTWEDDHLGYLEIHYLYTRSFYPNNELSGMTQKVHEYYLGQAEKYWLNKGAYLEGMLSLALHRNDEQDTAAKIIRSLKERSMLHPELGRYWKADYGYNWYQLPIESHSLLIEAFAEVTNDSEAVDELKIWLLKNKQTNHWKTTKATSAAVYALLMNGDNWLLEEAPVDISIGGKKLEMEGRYREAGTGYFKQKWAGDEVNEDMAQITVENPNSHIAWGAVYWQYFEDLDKIKTFEETPLTIKKSLFTESLTDRGPVLNPVQDASSVAVGDKVVVRIEIRVDRPMEYVHMKDMRASGFEPMNVLSQYKWQGGLGYYESTRDASTNFFIEYLPRGTYVFEYPLRAIHRGDFSNGITTIQCMYAPEFTSHSEGISVEVH